MKASHILMAIIFIVSSAARAQDVTAATGPPGLPVSGTLRYDLRYSQTAQFDGYADGQQRAYTSGDASYANTSKRRPFAMQYGGGYSWAWNGPPTAGNVFQHLTLSQGFVGKKWNFTASNNFGYIFQTPTTGFSGVPGTGEPLGGTGTTTLSDQTILTQNTRTVDNITTLAFVEKLDRAWSISTGATLGQMRFLDGNGQNMDTLTAKADVTHRLNAHNSLSGQYSFSRFSYGGANYSTQTNNLQFRYTRQWNKNLNTTVAAGPTWLSSSGVPSTGSIAVPNSTMLFLDALASYALRHGSANANYSHYTTGGSGYLLGAKIDNISGNFSRDFGKNLTVGVTGSYVRTSALIAAELAYACTINNVLYYCVVPLNLVPVTGARYGGVQATHKLGRRFNVFVNYTSINQSSDLQIAVPNSPLSYNANILNGLNQVIGFGIGYSPREMHFRK
jgi:hypothetical protein